MENTYTVGDRVHINVSHGKRVTVITGTVIRVLRRTIHVRSSLHFDGAYDSINLNDPTISIIKIPLSR